ncbi:AEC family transporter [Konateibacter massiliensis]|uniref:AEC family transporter n=1 Tax=Konateibacter massiliensis TaxID=2002841 RepID=UPI000C150F49|nr:transporter [Konateibacter massiliensis]
MNILATILPVFFMIGLGILSKKKKIVTQEQALGMNSVVCNILFPIMVFNALFITSLEASALLVVGYVFVLHIAAILVGTLTGKIVGGKFAHISKYLMCSVDGGNVCFPLYATIVGASYIGNIVLLDIAGIFIIFLVIPLIVSAKESNASNIKALLKHIICTPLVISLISGFLLNRVGLYQLLQTTGWDVVYTNVASMATAPIVAMILFMIGYQFKIEKSSIKPLLLCVVCRMAIMGVGAAIFTQLFSHLVADKTFFIAILLFFMCPPALVLINQVSPLFKDEDDASFMSAFVSLYMIVTLAAFTGIVVFVA